jgi:hypothetical protein
VTHWAVGVYTRWALAHSSEKGTVVEPLTSYTITCRPKLSHPGVPRTIIPSSMRSQQHARMANSKWPTVIDCCHCICQSICCAQSHVHDPTESPCRPLSALSWIVLRVVVLGARRRRRRQMRKQNWNSADHFDKNGQLWLTMISWISTLQAKYTGFNILENDFETVGLIHLYYMSYYNE